MGISTVVAIVAAVAAVAGAGVSAVGSIQQGNAAQATANYNAAIEQQNAQQALAASQANAAITQQQTRRKLGEAAAAFGGAGVDMQGSPLDVMSDLATQGELQRRITLYQGTPQARGLTSQAGLDVAGGQAAASAGLTKAGGSLLTGISAAGKSLSPFLSGPTSTAGTSPLAPQHASGP